MMLSKKGSYGFIIAIIILAVTFAILFYLIVIRLHPFSTRDTQVCTTTLTFKGISLGLSGTPNCKTQYICISGGDPCTNINPSIPIIKVDPTNKTQIMQKIAEQMANCWAEFGAGKIDYQNVGAWDGLEGNICGVCSIIGFDDKVQEALSLKPEGTSCKSNTECLSGDCDSTLHVCLGTSPGKEGTTSYQLTYKDLLNYLAITPSSEDNQQSYLQYLYGFYTLTSFLKASPTVNNDFYSNNKQIDFSGQYAIITGEGAQWSWNWAIWDLNSAGGKVAPKFLPPVLINVNDVSSTLGSQCPNFVTQS